MNSEIKQNICIMSVIIILCIIAYQAVMYYGLGAILAITLFIKAFSIVFIIIVS